MRSSAFGHSCSVPSTCIGHSLEARLAQGTIECFCKSERVATLPRSVGKRHYTTVAVRMLERHRRAADRTPERLIRWPRSITKERMLDKPLITELAPCRWIRSDHNVLTVGSTGTGKTYLACALAHKACLEGFSSRTYRMNHLLHEPHVGRVDGAYDKLDRGLLQTEVLMLDDLDLNPM